VTIKVDLSPETEARLIAQARVQGLPLEQVAERLLHEALTAIPASHGRISVEEFHQMLADISEGSENLPELRTETFSRESFYEDPIDGRNGIPHR
jgi:hypothetical protein